MLRVGFVVVAMAAGCFSTPSFNGVGRDGGSDGSCTTTDAAPVTQRTDAQVTCTWSTPVPLPGAFFGDVTGQPTMNAAMTLLMWDYGPNGSTNDLHYATRGTADSTWAVYDDEPFDTGNNTFDMDPSLNDAGDVLFFLSNADGGVKIYEARHTCAGWSVPLPVETSAPIPDVVGIDTVGDGNTIYVAFGGGDMRTLKRPDRNTPFARLATVVDAVARYPGVSPDELSVYQANVAGQGLDHYTRSSKASAFDTTPVEHLFGTTLVTDADILDDGVHMIVGLDRTTVGMSTCQ